VLKEGEGIISEDFAKKYFLGKNPIGAIQTLTIFDIQPIPITIVDVYKTSRVTDYISSSEILYYCIANNIEDLDLEKCFTAIWIDVVLKGNSTRQQLLKEINDRVKPLGLTAELTKVADQTQINLIITIRLLGYMIGSLILLSAIIGFLRIQTQLFRIRRREMSLRLVNGATRLKLFSLLLTEVAITICLSIVIALILGGLLQDFCNGNLNIIINDTGIKVDNLRIVSLEIGGALLVICSMVAWVMLQRIVKSDGGLSANMHRSRNHLFRNTMLGIQIVISLIFVSSTFILVNAGDKLLKACNVPENDDFYRDCLYLEPTGSTDRNMLLDEIKRLPELEKVVIMAANGYHAVKEVGINPELKVKFSNQEYFKTYCIQDTSLVSLLGMDVDWLTQSNKRNEGLLISENLYNRFNELGLLDTNSLTIIYSWTSQPTLPIIGIIRKMPYDMAGETLVALQPKWEDYGWEYILVPKEGKGKALERSVNETIDHLYPQLINKMVFNYREKTNELPGFVEAVRAGGWILGGISLIICAMTIFSTIALDTRARRKEVAIRKVNGAKSKDIYRMFGRTYIVLIIISLFIAIPICVIFNSFAETFVTDLDPKSTISPVLPIIFGCGVVILLILSIVSWQIHKVMRIDAAKIIAKE
ncbi:MAG: FtsX-like permease family protein, partial [Muribaculaceae bacterium]|nr:FtsX-like permease family protein [Muribaculaceae bacterium]